MIEPEKFYPADAPELDVLGAKQTRARHRHEGKGCPYFKVGSRVFYRGADVLDYVAGCRIETEAA